MKHNYDVIVIGGGPAGATTAALVAEEGHDVLLMERDEFPRFRIGESLMPGTYWTLQRLGVFEKMKKSAFVKKHSVQFFGPSGRGGLPFYFSEIEPQERAQTWQVLRSEFDQLMVENAREKGADIKYGVQALDFLFDGEQVVGVTAKLPDKSLADFGAKVVVDASGQSALLSRKLRISHDEPLLQNAAIYTHYRGAFRDSGIDEGATLICHTENSESWFWYIPLHRDVVSVGVVGHIDYLLKNREGRAQEIFDEELATCPSVMPRVEGAEQLFPVRTTKEFSYKSTDVAGNGWVLVGDAFGFLDPIYSSGVYLALKSGELAADAINEALERNDFSAHQLQKFGPEFLRGMNAIRKLVYAFYDKDFSFARFLKQYPMCRRDIVNILVGNVYKEPVDELFEHMDEFGVHVPA